jgi:hypothetical protein
MEKARAVIGDRGMEPLIERLSAEGVMRGGRLEWRRAA